MDASYIQGRIAATKALIEAYEAAALALGNGVQSYTLDTGQTRQIVTRADVKELNATVDTLYNRCATLEARLNGGTAIIARGPR